LKSCVEPLAKELGTPIFMPLDVATPGMLDGVREDHQRLGQPRSRTA
jgi:hypothetical protein